MTNRNILADRLVEKIFKKPAPAPPNQKEPEAPMLVTLQIEDARKRRKQRQQLVNHFQEF